MEPGESITVEYEFTREDYLRWVVMLQERAKADPRWRQFYQWRNFVRVAAPVFTVATVALVWAKWTDIIDRGNTGQAGLIVGMGAGAVGAWWQLSQWRGKTSPEAVRAALERDADSPRARLWQGRKRVTVGPASFVWEARHTTFIHRWWYVGALRKDGGFLLMDMGSEGAWPIPLRAFADEGAADRFIALASKYRDASPPGPAADIRELLKDRDFACPGCTYNLRGIEGEKCPECGRGVGVGEVLGRV